MSRSVQFLLRASEFAIRATFTIRGCGLL